MRFARSLVLVLGVASVYAQTSESREQQLLTRIQELEQRVAALEAKLAPAAPAPAPEQHSQVADSPSLPGFLAGTTFNVLFDGYYEYNFNHPAGRSNLLRPFDPASNSFTVNQAVIAIERAPDPEHGRRWGARLDLMLGQATEALAGNPANEPRTAPYRNVYQAYGSYVVPVGKGLNVDFGRFASPIGFENSFAKDQINYTRSLLFAALPFYHSGFRTSYKLGGSTTATWMLVNGINQTEDFNGFKTNAFMLTTALSKAVNLTASYCVGRESRDLTPSGAPILPRPDGRTHIADIYATWTATPKLTLVAEADYIASRTRATSPPAHLVGGAGYLKYQFAPAFSLAGRFEYVSDQSLLTGATQALKEGTLTVAYQPLDGFQVRWEFRRDYSNQPFFPASQPGVTKKEQSTALVGLLWWFGGKQGSW